MSVQVIAWVLDSAEVDDPTEVLILVGLANHAHPDGTAAWPSINTLARYARVSRSTVIRKLQGLEERGVIARGNQDHIPKDWPANRRPVVYDIVGVSNCYPSDSLGCQNEGSGVSNNGFRGVTGDTQTVLKPYLNREMSNDKKSKPKPSPYNDEALNLIRSYEASPNSKTRAQEIRQALGGKD